MQQYIGNAPGTPLDTNGGVPVNIQDQTTEPRPSFFLQDQGGNVTVATATGASGITAASLVYNVAVSPAHGIIAGTEILLLDVSGGNRELLAVVKSVAVDNLTIDRPIDHDFPIGSLVRIVKSEMVGDGSTTPEIFTVRSGMIPSDTITMTLTMLCATEPDFTTFGDQAELPRGLVFRIVNSFQKTIYCLKTNKDIYQFWDTVEIKEKVGGSEWAVVAKVNLSKTLGVALRIDGTDVLQFVNQDAITITSLKASLGSHLTQGEV